MCGRFTQTFSSSDIAKAFNLKDVPELEPRYNIAPTQQVATVIPSDSKNRQFQWLRWGLIPDWAKDRRIGNQLINARAETVAEKRSFKSLFIHSRCLIIASGFYEWQQQQDRKQPFYIQQKNSLSFAFAGLFSTWQHDKETLSTCTIITTKANQIMEPIHNRMPVILSASNYSLWLDPTVQTTALLQPLLQPYDSEKLKIYPVISLVNNPRNDSSECLKSIEC